MHRRKSGFTLVELTIGIAVYSVLILTFLYLFNMLTQYKADIVSYNYTLYEKELLQDYDVLVGYKGWQNKIISEQDKTFCNTLDADSSIFSYVITYSNIREKRFYKILYFYKINGTSYYNVQVVNDLSSVYLVKDTAYYARGVRSFTESLKGDGFYGISFSKINNTFSKNLLFLDKNFMN